MGSCTSIYRKSDSSRKNLASLVHLETNKNPDSMPCTPVKNNKPDLLVPDLPVATTFSNYGSKEESFFDSKAWLESDCDDDFYSVRGDFTPSRGNSPIHSSRNLSPSRGLVVQGENRSFFCGDEVQVDIKGQADGEKKKNKLGDLFHESATRSDKDDTPPPSKRTPPCCFPSPRRFKKTLFSPPPVTVDA